MSSQTRRHSAGAACAIGAFVVLIVAASVGGTACGSAEGGSFLLTFVSAGLAGASVAMFMPETRWRFVVVPILTLVVLLASILVWALFSVDSHYCA